jgi:transposase-like protein
MSASKDPKWRPVVLLEQFGILTVIGEAESSSETGRRVKLRCRACKSDDIRSLPELRAKKARGQRPRCEACGQTTVK